MSKLSSLASRRVKEVFLVCRRNFQAFQEVFKGSKESLIVFFLVPEA